MAKSSTTFPATNQSMRLPGRCRVYLAGKITGDWWRNTLLDDDAFQAAGAQPAKHLVSAVCPDFLDNYYNWPLVERGVLGSFDYVGPYVVDVWGGHGNPLDSNSHGVIDTMETEAGEDSEAAVLERLSWSFHWFDPFDTRSEVVRRSLEAIDRSDIVFAWINRNDVAGTLIELGYARARGKTVWIGFDFNALGLDPAVDTAHDLWFAEHICDAATSTQSDPRDSFMKLWERYADRIGVPFPGAEPDLKTMPYKDYLKTEHWQQVRAGALERSGNLCQLCSETKQLQVHHNTYERRGCEEPGDLIVLCKACHERFHGVKNGKVTRMPVKS